MRLDNFLKTVDCHVQLMLNLITTEPEEDVVSASGVKQEVIKTLIGNDVSDFNMFDIYLVNLIYNQIGAEKYPVIYILAKETF